MFAVMIAQHKRAYLLVEGGKWLDKVSHAKFGRDPLYFKRTGVSPAGFHWQPEHNSWYVRTGRFGVVKGNAKDDESSCQTAFREFYEETGCRASNIKMVSPHVYITYISDEERLIIDNELTKRISNNEGEVFSFVWTDSPSRFKMNYITTDLLGRI